MPLVALVVCGAPLARRTGDMVGELATGGWDVDLVGTPAARDWIDTDEMSSAHGVVPRFDFRSPAGPDRRGDPDVVVVCPATFNTTNKIAAGIADNYATSLACEVLGSSGRVIFAPMVNNKLWGHPALSVAVAMLMDAGATFLDVQTGERGLSPVPSGSGDRVVSAFKTTWLLNAVQSEN